MLLICEIIVLPSSDENCFFTLVTFCFLVIAIISFILSTKFKDVIELPFVIAGSGFGGWEQKIDRRLMIMSAQKSVAESNEFNENARYVETRGFFRDGPVSPRPIRYHWCCNAESYWFTPNIGSSYFWTVDPAIGVLGTVYDPVTNTLVIDWSGVIAGYYSDAIIVVETDANGCENTDQVDVIVNALPTTDFSSPNLYLLIGRIILI